MPYVEYKPAFLSARRPIYNKESGKLKITVENYGLYTSNSQKVKVICGDTLIAIGKVKTLQFYESTILRLNMEIQSADKNPEYKVIFH